MPAPRMPAEPDLPLSRHEIAAALRDLPGWTCRKHALEKRFHFPTFRAAIAFMLEAAFIAEVMDHHPDWSNRFDTVHVLLTTHHSGNRVTAKDVELAMKFEGLARAT